MTTVARLSNFNPTPQPDGNHIVEVTTGDGKTIDVSIPRDLVPGLVNALQFGLMNRVFQENQAGQGGESHSLTKLTVRVVGPAHRGLETNISVLTDEVGTLVLKAEDEDLRRMREAIDEILALRSSGRVN